MHYLYTNILLVMWGTNTMKEFSFSVNFIWKNSIFGVFKKNFVVDCFWWRTWAGSTISHQNITFTQGFWLVKEFWWSDVLMKKSTFVKLGIFLDFLRGENLKWIYMCYLYTNVFFKNYISILSQLLVLESTHKY